MENRSLAEFQHEESQDEAEPAQDTGVKTGSTTPASERTAGAAQPTMDWTPDGAVCADCGVTVQRRWIDGENERLVCVACKQWE